MELDFLTRVRMIEQGRIQRYLIKELFTSLNAVSLKYTFEVFSTQSNIDVQYDGLICIRDKSTETILQWFIVQVNIDTEQTNYIYKQDYKRLMKSKYKFINDSFSQIYRPLYINFTETNTVLYSLDEIKLVETKENGRLAYILNERDGQVKNFVYDKTQHHKELLIEQDIIEEEIKGIYIYINELEEHKELIQKKIGNKRPNTSFC